MPKTLSTHHPRIVSFYENHPSISFESTNLFIIELYDKLFSEMTPIPLPKDSYSTIINKLSEFKQDYMSEFQKLIQSSSQDQGKFAFENSDFINKMTHIIEQAIPPQQDAALSQIQDSLQKFHDSLQKGTSELLKNHSDSNSFQHFLQNFEIKYSIMLNNIQQPINSFLVAIENRINANMTFINENNIIAIKDSIHASTTSMHEKIAQEFAHVIKNTMPNSYNNSSISTVLTKIYKTAEIYPVESNLFTLKRLRKQPIFIQSIHSDENVSVETVESFIHLIDEKNSSGVLLSQCSGISTKKDFQIEIYQNNIVVFIHNSQYSSSHIELAVSVIDNLYTKLRQFNTTAIQDHEFTIPKEMLDTINTEYQLFLTQKNAVVELFKENQKKVISQMDELSELFSGFILKLNSVNIISDINFLTSISIALGKIVNLSKIFGKFKQTIFDTSVIQFPKSAHDTKMVISDVMGEVNCAMHYINYFVSPTETGLVDAQLSADEKNIISKSVDTINNWNTLCENGVSIAMANNPDVQYIKAANEQLKLSTVALKNNVFNLKRKLAAYNIVC